MTNYMATQSKLTNLSAKQLRQAAQIKDQIDALGRRLAKMLGASESPAAARGPAKRRTMSASARARIAAAQRARWAKLKAAKHGAAKPGGKRTMSASARAKIAAAQRARWAKVKAAKAKAA